MNGTMKTDETESGADSAGNSMTSMIDEARRMNERTRRSAAGAKFMAELISYITAESKRNLGPKAKEQVPEL